MIEVQELHVVFGVGEVGRATGAALLKRGKRVRFVSRRGINPLAGHQGADQGQVEALAADATDESGRRAAAKGATVVYDCTNPPAYNKWATLLPPLTRGVLDAAEWAGARLVQASNLYMYGRVDGHMTEATPVKPCSSRGELRAMLAEEALSAHREGRVIVTIGRASDFYGITEQAALGTRALKAVLEGKPVDVLGNPDRLHSYTYIPDFGEALATLGEHPEAAGRVWHVPTPVAITTRQMLELAGEIVGKRPRIRVASRPMLAVASLFVPKMRGLGEMLYQFENDFVLDSSAFQLAFGKLPTDREFALRRSLEQLAGSVGHFSTAAQ